MTFCYIALIYNIYLTDASSKIPQGVIICLETLPYNMQWMSTFIFAETAANF